MSITNEIQRLQTAKSNLKTQLEAKGVSVSANATLDAYPNYVSEITPMVYSGDVQSIIDAFAGGTLSGSINISSANTNNLRDYLFYNMQGITGVTYYAEGNKSIPNHCFENCTNLSSVNIVGPGKVTSVGENAFYECRSIHTLPFLEDLKTIGNAAFHNCPLTGITFNSGLTAIGKKAFWYDSTSYGALSGQGITIPSNISDLEGDYSNGTFQNTCATAFTFMGNITKLGNSWGNSNYCYFRGNSQCELYDFSHNYSVPSRVPPNEFENSKEGYRIVVPQILYDKWITTQNWTGFTSHIDSGQNLYDVTTYGYSYTGSTAPSITDKDGFSILSNTASEGEGSITIYGKNNNELFSGKSVITAVTISNAVTEIGNQFCYNCNGLTSVTIPDSVITIGVSAFNNCTSLTSVTIPDSVRTIDFRAFYGCPIINTGFTFPDGLEYIGDKAFGTEDRTSAVNIGTDSGETTFNIPDSVTYIGKNFLSHSDERGTTYINIGSGITHIDNGFYYRYGATWNHKVYITFKGTVPPYVETWPDFDAIYVPAESVETYRSAPSFQNFADRIFPIPEE